MRGELHLGQVDFVDDDVGPGGCPPRHPRGHDRAEAADPGAAREDGEVDGIVVVGALWALLNATSTLEQVIGFAGVLLGAGNAAGGYVVTERMLQMFKPSSSKPPKSGG